MVALQNVDHFQFELKPEQSGQHQHSAARWTRRQIVQHRHHGIPSEQTENKFLNDASCIINHIKNIIEHYFLQSYITQQNWLQFFFLIIDEYYSYRDSFYLNQKCTFSLDSNTVLN